MSFETVFGSQKPIIGMIHLLPLPGAPHYGGSMEQIWDAALADLNALTEGGISAALRESNIVGTSRQSSTLTPPTFVRRNAVR